MVLQARTKVTAGPVLSQNAVTACVLLNGHDLLCIVLVPHFIFRP